MSQIRGEESLERMSGVDPTTKTSFQKVVAFLFHL
jgi:hypothetical protein